jgi:DNA-binding transcriptional LysR family regulator
MIERLEDEIMRAVEMVTANTPTNELSRAIDEFKSLAASLELFVLVYRFLKERPQSSYPEIAEQIRLNYGIDIPHHRLSGAIRQLEKQLGLRLVNSAQKSKANSLSASADRLYAKADELINRTLRLKDSEPSIRVGAPDLLINLVIPTVAAEFRRNRSDDYKHVAFEVSECRESEEIVNKVGSGAIDFALTWAYDDKLDRLVQLGTPRGLKVERLFEVEGVGFDSSSVLEFDILMICSPTHRFVDEAKKAAKPGRPWKVSLTDLKDEQVVVLPPRRQPLLKNIPMVPGSKGRFIEVDSFTQVLAHVRGLISNAVGLVPSIYTEINELRRKGQIFCAPIADLPKDANPQDKGDESHKSKPTKVSIACVSQVGIGKLNKDAQDFLRCSEPILRRIARLEDFELSELEEVPGEIAEFRRYQYCYFVMQHERIFGVPGWFEGELSWESADAKEVMPDRVDRHREGRLRGHLGGTFITTTTRKWWFNVNGWLRQNEDPRAQNDRSFQFVGEGQAPNQKNTIICTFNIRVHYENYDVLVGVWSGRDDHGLATVAPMVLVQKSFGRNISMLRSIISKTSYRFLPNAEDWGKSSE